MKFWQSLAMVKINELVPLTKAAEEFNFDGVLLSDHLVTFSEQYDKYYDADDEKVVWDPGTDWPDPLVQIGALSQVTNRIKFLVSVYVLPLRDPFSAAKAISTASILSKDRLILGIGVGWQKAEFNVLGKSFSQRGKRTDEMLEIIRKLITGKEVFHHGKFYDFDRLTMSPGVLNEIPILIGGFSDFALKRAISNAGWIGIQYEIEDLKVIVGKLHAIANEIGVDIGHNFEVIAAIKNPSKGKYKIAEDIGVTSVYRDAWLDSGGRASILTLDEKIEDMKIFSDEYIL